MHEHAQRHSACSWRAQQHHVEVFLAPVQSKRMQINKKGGDKACITLTRVSKKRREMQSWQSRLKQNHLRSGMGKEKEALPSQAVGGKALGDWGWTWLQHISKLLNHWSGLKSQWVWRQRVAEETAQTTAITFTAQGGHAGTGTAPLVSSGSNCRRGHGTAGSNCSELLRCLQSK